MDSIFFWVSKIVWMLISPDSLLLVLCVSSWVLLWRNKLKPAKWLAGITAVLFLIGGVLPSGEWLIAPLEKHFTKGAELPASVDGILVLGGAIEPSLSAAWGQPETNEASERLSAFLQLANIYPDAALVFTGGSGALLNQEIKGADIARNYFSSLGLYSERVVFERDSRNTHENFTKTLAMVSPAKDETWILVTSAFHMPRSIGVARKQGWDMLPYPVDHYSNPENWLRFELKIAEHLVVLHRAVREWVGLIAYRLTGKTDSLLPAVGK